MITQKTSTIIKSIIKNRTNYLDSINSLYHKKEKPLALQCKSYVLTITNVYHCNDKAIKY